MTTDPHEILGLEVGATVDDVKAAYRDAIRRIHPDVTGTEVDAAVMAELTEARDKLLFARAASAPRVEEVMPEVLVYPEGFVVGERGATLTIGLRLTLQESMFGTERFVATRPWVRCSKCGGTGALPSPDYVESGDGTIGCGGCGSEGRRRGEGHVLVTIPPGTHSGDKIPLYDAGDAGKHQGTPGDVIIAITVEPHPTLRVIGMDLAITIELPMTEAALGSIAYVMSIDEVRLPIEVPAGVLSGQVLSIADHGVPYPDGSGRGKLLVEIVVNTPTGLDDRQRDLLWQLAQLRGEKPRRF